MLYNNMYMLDVASYILSCHVYAVCDYTFTN